MADSGKEVKKFKEVSMLEWTDYASFKNLPNGLVLQESQSNEEYAGKRDSISELSVVALPLQGRVDGRMLLQNWAR